jgi:hypothetical protein
MANPNPQHTPTDGLGVAAYVTLSGSSGSSVIHNSSGGANKSNGNNGQGIGPGTAASGSFPVAQYSLTLSVSAAGGYASSLAVTAALKDVSNSAYTPVGTIVAKSYNNPSAGSPAWYNPSNFAGYSADVASVSESGVSSSNEVFTITALNPGQAIVECQFPTFDNTNGDYSQTGNPKDMIYVQVVVTVIP